MGPRRASATPPPQCTKRRGRSIRRGGEATRHPARRQRYPGGPAAVASPAAGEPSPRRHALRGDIIRPLHRLAMGGYVEQVKQTRGRLDNQSARPRQHQGHRDMRGTITFTLSPPGAAGLRLALRTRAAEPRF